ncbi:MAG: hypothetical protein LBF68_00050 [Christensenellaceae bacterium]|nr:hypothetical protein [Christensenellaceae bacterium]
MNLKEPIPIPLEKAYILKKLVINENRLSINILNISEMHRENHEILPPQLAKLILRRA